MTRPSWRSGVGGTHWLKQAQTTLIAAMGGGSWWVERMGPSRFYTGFSRSASSPVLAKEDHAMEADIVAYRQKPVHDRELIAALQRVLSEARRARIIPPGWRAARC